MKTIPALLALPLASATALGQAVTVAERFVIQPGEFSAVASAAE
jgi:hypothetical protein